MTVPLHIMDRDRERSPRITVNREFVNRLSTGQIFQLMNLCVLELLQRFNVPRDCLDHLELRFNRPAASTPAEPNVVHFATPVPPDD